MLFSKCLRAKIYCNMNGHFDPQGCQTLLLKESELFFLSLGSWTICVFLLVSTSKVLFFSFLTDFGVPINDSICFSITKGDKKVTGFEPS